MTDKRQDLALAERFDEICDRFEREVPHENENALVSDDDRRRFLREARKHETHRKRPSSAASANTDILATR